MTMRWLSSRQSLPWWLLIISIAFNLGFGATYGIRTYGPPATQVADATDGETDNESTSIALQAESLDLTTEQRAELEELNRQTVEQIHTNRSEMFEARRTLADLLTAEETDRDAIDALLDEMNDIQRRTQTLVVEHLLLEKQLLGPEQRAVFHDILRRNIFPRSERGMGRGHERGRGPGAGPPSGRGSGGEGRHGRGDARGRGRDRGPGPGPGPVPPGPPGGVW
jgi:Spy/CpxP family protein refolding chaperone